MPLWTMLLRLHMMMDMNLQVRKRLHRQKTTLSHKHCEKFN